ncbi:MAG: hypothetical protein MUC40_07190 [Akkermansiaceae bacterium]|nr:hypothetical protein [Akkermansiaceae bacterium]
MKPIHLAPPVVALAIAASCLGVQRGLIATMERENTRLRKEIAAARAEEAAGERGGKAAAEKKKTTDWKKIAGDLGGFGGHDHMPDMRAWIRLQQLILNMGESELTAALDEIAALDLPESAREQLEGMLIGALAEKNPELALNRFIGKADNEGGMYTRQLQQSFEKWLGSEPANASAWFDRQLAAGAFDSKSLDGKSPSRLRFEGILIKSLLSSDPAAAARRMNEIPPEQRKDVFWGSFHSVEEKDQKALADFVRSTLPEEERTEILSNQMMRHAMGGDLTKINDYLARIDATPAERAACVEKAAESRFIMLAHERKATREDFDQFRTWAASADPASADRATGTALAASLTGVEGMSYDEVSAIASDYHAAGAGDDLLIALLEHWSARSSKDKARELAMMIADEKRREEVLKNLE